MYSPFHDLLVPGKKISPAMLDRNSLAFKVIGVFDIQHQDLADLFIGETFLAVKLIQIVIGILGRLGSIVLVTFANYKVDRRPVLHHRLIISIPLGTALEIGSEKIRPLSHNLRHGLSAPGIAFSIDSVRIDIIVIQKIFHQGNGLICRSLSPVRELRSHDDHIRIIVLSLKTEVLTVEIFSHSLKIQTLISGQGKNMAQGSSPS